MLKLTGIAASSGVGYGPVLVLADAQVTVPDHDDPKAAFAEAVAAVRRDLEDLRDHARASDRAEAADVLTAQALMAEDPMFVDAVGEALDLGNGLGDAISIAAAQIAEMLASLSDPYLAARSADVLEVAGRVSRWLAGIDDNTLANLTERSVIAAQALTAAQTAQLDPLLVLGFVTEEGGPTGHVAVIARSLAIPAVVGVEGLMAEVGAASTIAIDGATGETVIDPEPEVAAEYEGRSEALRRLREAATRYRGTVVRFDGEPLGVAANVGGPTDVLRAVETGADGIGLYRTEFLFLDRDSPPTEDEQYEVYSEAARSFDHPVVIRTFDIGGDKPSTYLDTPVEENPFLGERGVRLYSRFDELFATQAAALIRAAAHGDIWIMVPMIATISDAVTARDRIREVRNQRAERGDVVGDPKIGIMVEVPSAALIAPALAREVDFFSIGTNDLTQYTLAADRTNARLAHYSDAAHPAVLRLCSEVAAAAHTAGITVSVCGEAAGDPLLALLFAAMGISKLSMAPPSVDLVKARISEADPWRTRDALAAALDAGEAATARTRAQEALDGAV